MCSSFQCAADCCFPGSELPRSSLHRDFGCVPALRLSSRELPAATAPKAKRHQPHEGVAAGDGRWNKRRGTKGKNKRGKRNPETVKRKAEEKRQLEEYDEYIAVRSDTPSSPSPVCTEVPSDNEEQLTALRVKAEQREKKEEVEEEDRREHGVRDVEFRDEPTSSNRTAASSRIEFTQYISSQEEKATSKWEEVYLAKRRRVEPERK